MYALIIGVVLIKLIVAALVYRWVKRRLHVKIVDAAYLSRQPGFAAYFDSFTVPDRIARGCDDCREVYLAQVIPAPPKGVVETLRRDAVIADKLCGDRAPGLMSVPWRVAILGRDAENGWPHTHGSVICLPLGYFDRGDSDRVETLIHERVHVYQRTHELPWRYGWKYGSVEMTHPLRRSNPDLDGRAYADRHGRTCVTLYNSETPRDLSDSTIVTFDASWRVVETDPTAYEHPLEEMAYRVAGGVTGG